MPRLGYTDDEPREYEAMPQETAVRSQLAGNCRPVLLGIQASIASLGLSFGLNTEFRLRYLVALEQNESSTTPGKRFPAPAEIHLEK